MSIYTNSPVGGEVESKKQKTLGVPLFTSIIFHALLLVLIGGAVIVHGVIPERLFVGDTVVPSSLAMDEDLQPIEDDAYDLPEMPAGDMTDLPDIGGDGTPMEAAFDVISTAVPTTSFALPVGTGVVGGTGQGLGNFGTGGGSGGGGLRKKTVQFFGAQAEGERIGFYLDFSGTMSGDRRMRLIEETRKTLEALPDGTAIVILIWSGTAWSLGEDHRTVTRFWTSENTFHFDLKREAMPPVPRYIVLDNRARAQILRQLERQEQVKGSTDWSAPFQLAARMPEPPDTVFLMTDGQFDTTTTLDRFRQIIQENLKSGDRRASLTIVAVGASSDYLRALRTLAADVNGKVVEVK